MPSLSTIATPTSFRGRPPRSETPASRKRRAAAAAAMGNNNTPSGQDSWGSSSIGAGSEQSSGQLRPAHDFTGGGMNLFGGMGGMGGGFDDDLDNFVQYVDEEDDDEEETSTGFNGQGEEVTARQVSFESDDGLAAAAPERQKREGWLFPFRLGRKRNRSSSTKSNPSKNNDSNRPSTAQQQQKQQTAHQTFHQPPHQFSQSAPPQYTTRTQKHHQPQQLQQHQQQAPHALRRPRSTLSQQVIPNEPPLLSVPSGSPTEEIHYNKHVSGQRSRSMPDYRT